MNKCSGEYMVEIFIAILLTLKLGKEIPMLAFLIWLLIGCAFVVLGIYSFYSKKETAFGFWANAETFPVNDVKAMGKLWCVFGIVFVALGLPLLVEQNSLLMIIPVIGCMLEAIITMAIYTTVIEKKYRKK